MSAQLRRLCLRIIPLVLAVLLLAGGSRLTGHVDAKDTDAKAGEIVVRLDPAADATIDAVNARYGTTTLRALTVSPNTYLLQAPPGIEAKAIVDQMAGDPQLLVTEPNYIGRAPEADPRSIKAWAGTDPTPGESQYAVAALGLARAHALSRGAGAVVAVIDTGVQRDHPALAGRLLAGYDFLDGDADPSDAFNGLDDDGDGLVDEAAGHGTHVAGIIHLVAPEAQILPLRALDSDGNGDEFAVAEAVNYAVAHGANVINLSLGTAAKSDLFREVARDATLRGVTVLAAAGNEGVEQEQYPAAAQCALPVTSVDEADHKSDFANYGGWIDVAAPGEGVYSSYPPSGYARWSGTSMATPFVAGQAALIRSWAPQATPRDIATLIAETARPLDALNPLFEGRLGKGRIDVGASLEYLVAQGFPTSGGGTLSGSCVSEGAAPTTPSKIFLPLLAR
jgi:subtilisin family serine protease